MNDIDNLLNGPDYFYCEYFKAKLKKKICIERQLGKHAVIDQYKESEIGLSFGVCQACEQGKKIRDELLTEKPRPQRGKGERKLDCAFYRDCLDRASKKEWKTFNCEHCFYFSGNNLTDKAENTRICEECKTNKTISPTSPYCPSCMAKKSNEKRAKKGAKKTKRPKAKTAKKTETHNKDRAEIIQPRGNMEVVISFKNHESILKKIIEVSEAELRSTENQILWMLINHVEGLN